MKEGHDCCAVAESEWATRDATALTEPLRKALQRRPAITSARSRVQVDAKEIPKWRATVDEEGHYCFAVPL